MIKKKFNLKQLLHFGNLFLLMGLAKGVSVGNSFLITRWFGIELLGKYSGLLKSIELIIAVLLLSVNEKILYHYREFVITKSKVKSKELIFLILTPFWSLILITPVIIYYGDKLYISITYLFTILFSFSIVIAASILNALKKTSTALLVSELMKPIILLITVLIINFWMKKYGNYPYEYIFIVCSAIISGMISIVIIKRYLMELPITKVKFKESLGYYSSYILRNYPVTVVRINSILLTGLGIFILNYYQNFAASGILTIGIQLSFLFKLISIPINQYYSPLIAENWLTGKKRRIANIMYKSRINLLFVNLVLLTTLILAIENIFRLYSVDLNQKNKIIVISIMVIEYFNSTNTMNGRVLFMTDNYKKIIKSALITMIINISISFTLYSKFDIYGLIAAYGTSVVFFNIYKNFQIKGVIN